jgi:hypothetical protein
VLASSLCGFLCLTHCLCDRSIKRAARWRVTQTWATRRRCHCSRHRRPHLLRRSVSEVPAGGVGRVAVAEAVEADERPSLPLPSPRLLQLQLNKHPRSSRRLWTQRLWQQLRHAPLHDGAWRSMRPSWQHCGALDCVR